MKFTRREPCANCPFRKDAKLAYWHPEMYLMLDKIELSQRDPYQFMKTFGCHKDRHGPKEDQEPCVGWLINQREHDLPSLGLRFLLVRHPEAVQQYEECSSPVPLYDTVGELVERNLAEDRALNPHRYDADGNYLGDDDPA